MVRDALLTPIAGSRAEGENIDGIPAIYHIRREVRSPFKGLSRSGGDNIDGRSPGIDRIRREVRSPPFKGLRGNGRCC